MLGFFPSEPGRSGPSLQLLEVEAVQKMRVVCVTGDDALDLVTTSVSDLAYRFGILGGPTFSRCVGPCRFSRAQGPRPAGRVVSSKPYRLGAASPQERQTVALICKGMPQREQTRRPASIETAEGRLPGPCSRVEAAPAAWFVAGRDVSTGPPFSPALV